MEPEAIKIDERGASGMRIPGAFVFRCDVFNPVTRTPDFETLQEFVITSLRQGDNVYVHCVTGIRRSVVVAALLSARLMSITLEAAMDIINQFVMSSSTCTPGVSGTSDTRVWKDFGWTKCIEGILTGKIPSTYAEKSTADVQWSM